MRRHVRRSLLAACLVAVGGVAPRPALAQTPADRAMIDVFRDTLGAITDPLQVLPYVERERNARPASDRELGRLRLGWALVRLGELSDSAPPLIEAQLQFYEASVRRAKWPYASFGLAATKLALDDIGAIEVRSVHQTAGSGWRWSAAKYFLEAVKADTSYITAAVELGLTVIREPRWVDLPPVITAMTRAANSGRAGNDVWLVLGRLQRHADSNRAALRSFDTYVSLAGADRSMGQLERGRTLFALGDVTEAERAYFAGAAEPSPEARALYRKDASWIADSAQLQEIDAATGEQLPAVLGRFWRDRETASGRASGSRIAEHYRRWSIAQRRYKLQPAMKRQWDFGQVFRSANSEVDDRGVIFMRHGDPDDRASFAADGVPPNESWVYHRPTGDLVLHFTLGLTASGWRLVRSLADIGANPCQMPDLLDSRSGLDPSFQLQADRARADSARLHQSARNGNQEAADFFRACVPGGLSRAQAFIALNAASASGVTLTYFANENLERDRARGERVIASSTTSDSDPLRYATALSPIIQAYGVGGREPGNGKLLLIWAIRGSDHPRADTIPGMTGVGYQIQIRANVTDSLGRLVTSIDSIRRYRAAQVLGERDHLSDLLTLDVPTGVYRVQISISDIRGQQGASRVAGGVPVPAFTGPMEMSDLVLGLEGERLAWNRGGNRFPLNPRNIWTQRESMEIGFELAGVTPGTPYRVRIGITDLGADSTAPAKASVEFANQASGAREFVTQSLGLGSLRPGRYLLSTTVIIGETVLRRDRRITISEAR